MYETGVVCTRWTEGGWSWCSMYGGIVGGKEGRKVVCTGHGGSAEYAFVAVLVVVGVLFVIDRLWYLAVKECIQFIFPLETLIGRWVVGELCSWTLTAQNESRTVDLVVNFSRRFIRVLPSAEAALHGMSGVSELYDSPHRLVAPTRCPRKVSNHTIPPRQIQLRPIITTKIVRS